MRYSVSITEEDIETAAQYAMLSPLTAALERELEHFSFTTFVCLKVTHVHHIPGNEFPEINACKHKEQ